MPLSSTIASSTANESFLSYQSLNHQSPANSIEHKLLTINQFIAASELDERDKDSVNQTVKNKDFNLLLRKAAAKANLIGLLKFLLENKCVFNLDLAAKGATSGTALEIAKKNQNKLAIDLLEEANPTFASCFNDITSSVKNAYFENSQVYITTNENQEEQTLSTLQKMDSVGQAFIGTSGLSSLNLAAVRKQVDYIVIIDPSNRTKLFWKNISHLIISCSNRKECLEKIKIHLLLSMDNYGLEKKAVGLYCKELSSPKSWLAQDDRFEKIWKIFKGNRFAFLQADLIDTPVCESIKKVFERFNLKTDTAYLSNIHDYINPEDYQQYEKSLECLLSKNTIIVDTHDQSFKITKELANLFFRSKVPLNTHQKFQYEFEKSPDDNQFASQRVKQRNGEPIRTLYPMIELAYQVKPSELFYQYGIKMKFFTDEEMKAASKKVSQKLTSVLNVMSEKIPTQLLIKLTTEVLYTKKSDNKA